MSKVVLAPFKAVAKVVGAVVNVVLGAIQPKKPSTSTASNQRLSKQLQPEDFRKIVFGETAGAVDLRFWEVHGADNTTYSEVIAVAGHEVDGFGNFYVEDDVVPFSGEAATGTLGGALWRSTNNGRVGNAALPVGAGSYWDASSKFTGTAHYALRWLYTDKKLPNGVPSRYTQIVRGAKVYDPRRDSTRGGSGPMRAHDQSTWSYSIADGNGVPIGRNNALQVLWYLLGWQVNGTVVCGRGISVDDIDFAAFIQAANDAEALRNYTDMILSTGDTHENNEGVLSCDGLLGEVLDAGGLWGYYVVKDDTADVAVDLGEDDLVSGDVSWDPFRAMAEQCNEVAGNYIDPASLFQSRAYPTVKDAAYLLEDNGRRRRKTQNFQAIQDPEFAQRTSRLMLNRGRYAGEFQATFNLRALRARAWNVVTLTVGRYGFDKKLFRVMAQSITPAGIEMVLREEHPSIYSGGTVEPHVPPSSLVKYDPRMEIELQELGVVPTSSGGANGTVIDGLAVNWQVPPGNVRRTEVQYKLSDDPYWSSAMTQQADSTSLFVGPLQPGSPYVVRARHISIHEVAGPWAYVGEDTSEEGRTPADSVYYEDGSSTEDMKPAQPGADVTGDNTSKDTEQVGGRPAADLLDWLDARPSVEQRINDLTGAIGDTESAAESANAAKGYAEAAETARTQSQAARDASQTAQQQAASNALASSQSATSASGSAATASGQATIATQKATEAGQKAATATAQADIATTRAGEAQVFRNQAATSENNAAGSATAAASSAGVSASARDAAGNHATGNLVQKGSFNDGSTGNWANVTNVAVTIPGNTGLTRAIQTGGMDIAEGPNREGNWSARKVRCRGWVNRNNASSVGAGIFGATATGGNLAPHALVDGQGPATGWYQFDVTITTQATMVVGRPFVRSAAPFGVQWAGLVWEDITESDKAEGSATASATSAATAAASATAAGQSASAANTDRIAAQTARGQAEAFSGQAATSANDAAGSAATAASQSSLAASSSSDATAASLVALMQDNNPDFDFGTKSWARTAANADAGIELSGPGVSFAASASGAQNVLNIGANQRVDMFSFRKFPVKPGRRYRLSARTGVTIGAGISFQIYMGVQCYNATGPVGTNSGYLYLLIPGTIYTTPGFREPSVEFDLSNLNAGTTSIRLIAWNNFTGVAGTTLLDYFRLEDITESDAASGFASAAATSASVATAAQTAAGNSATSATQSANTATTQNGLAQQAAAASQSSAAAASASEASAASSALLSATFSANALTDNSNFANYPVATGTPPNWSAATSGAAGDFQRVTGRLSPYALRIIGRAGTAAYTAQSKPASPKIVSNAQWMVIEAEVTLNSGSLSGSGVLFRPYNSARSSYQDLTLSFSADPANSDSVVGAGVAGQTYAFSKMVKVNLADAATFDIYAMAHWAPLGAIGGANDITFHKVLVRPAIVNEIVAQKALADAAANAVAISAAISSEASTRATADGALGTRIDSVTARAGNLESSVSVQAGAIASLQSKTGAYWQVVAQAPDGKARISVVADGYGSAVELSADTIALGTQRTFVVEAGRAAVKGDLYLVGGLLIQLSANHMRVSGNGFGRDGDLMVWSGPPMAINQCTRANAKTYETVGGDVYTSGTIIAGVRRNAVQTTSIALNAAVTTGPVGSDGGARVVVLSYAYLNSYSYTGPAGAGNGALTASLILSRNGVDVTTLNAPGTWTRGAANGASEPSNYVEQFSGSTSYTDNTGGTSVTYSARLVSRGQGPGGAGAFNQTTTQNISIVQQE